MLLVRFERSEVISSVEKLEQLSLYIKNLDIYQHSNVLLLNATPHTLVVILRDVPILLFFLPNTDYDTQNCISADTEY